MTDSLLDYRLDGSLAVLTLDDGKANAIPRGRSTPLTAALDRAEDARPAAVVFAGRPGRFSAGFDLPVMTEGDEAMRGLVTAGAELLLRVFTLPAARRGRLHRPRPRRRRAHAAAPPTAASAPTARARSASMRWPSAWACPIFAVELAHDRLPPPALTRPCSARIYDPAGAVDAGYLDRVVPADDLVAEATAEALQLAELSRGAVAHSKRLARQGIVDDIRSRLAADMAATSGPRGAN